MAGDPRTDDGAPPEGAGGLAAFAPLRPAERRIVAELQSGRFDRLGDGLRPSSAAPERVVRAEFIRFILLGGAPGCRPHEKGLRVTGAFVEGTLDLEGCRIPRDIGLNDCTFEGPVIVRSAIIDNLLLAGSALPALMAERVEARGGLSLNGAVVCGEIALRDARIGGSLEADGVEVHWPGDVALDAAGAQIEGSVLLRGAAIEGTVRLARARLGADLNCVGLEIGRGTAAALDGEGLEVRGNVALREARVEGEVELRGVAVGGDVDCSGARLHAPGGFALQLNRSDIAGVFFLRRGARLEGALDLRQTTIGAIEDDRASWPAAGELLLNRCRYAAFIGGPVDAASRLDWLALQAPERWGEDFWPQPYEQLSTVFADMGHDEDAREVLIAKERAQRRARRLRARSRLHRWRLALVDGLLGVTVLYGRRPLLAFVWLLAAWAGGVAVFGAAERAGAFQPSLPFILRSPEWLACAIPVGASGYFLSLDRTLPGRAAPGQTQLDCFRAQPEAASYPKFSLAMYTVDVVLPVIEIGQTAFWRPDPSRRAGDVALNAYYVLKIIGWALSLLAIAGFSGLVKSR